MTTNKLLKKSTDASVVRLLSCGVCCTDTGWLLVAPVVAMLLVGMTIALPVVMQVCGIIVTTQPIH